MSHLLIVLINHYAHHMSQVTNIEYPVILRLKLINYNYWP